MPKDSLYHNSLQKLSELVKDIGFAMLTTEDGEGHFRSRPMGTQEVDTEEGLLWFFTSDDSPKTDEIAHQHQVNVSYASPEDNRYVSVSGTAQVLHDKEKMKELWKPMFKAWFPKGLEDPHLALIRVDIERAEYWDFPNSKMMQLLGFVKALATGKSFQATAPGENKKIRVN